MITIRLMVQNTFDWYTSPCPAITPTSFLKSNAIKCFFFYYFYHLTSKDCLLFTCTCFSWSGTNERWLAVRHLVSFKWPSYVGNLKWNVAWLFRKMFKLLSTTFCFVFVFVGRKRPIILTDDGLDGLVIRVLLGTARTSSSMEAAKRSEINGGRR